ncbi:MAG: PIG-L family deacetylase, partial [Chloroflexota bacterium]|nr:PIG-L family deacetylase [Chloroflexota bacterium]
MRPPSPFTLIAILITFSLLAGSGAIAAQEATPSASPVVDIATPGASPVADEEMGNVDLDVLFIGAHPDDEAGGLSTYGLWNERFDMQVGVITITRGEGGGNAVGTEEGPALGLLREAEERRAVGKAGIEHVYNLDKVDFYYTVSAPLTEEVWGYSSTLERIVRVVRETTPEVIVTMNPSPTPGNHGHHQMAARLAVDAFDAAADTEMFPDQIETEGLAPWRAGKIVRRGASGEGQPGEGCPGSFQAEEPTDYVFGVWAGHTSDRHGGATWAQVEIDAQREYASQGWATFEDAPTDPAEIECDYFTLIDTRVPFTVGNTEPTAILEGALLPAQGGLPVGTEFWLEVDNFYVGAGLPVPVTAYARAASGGAVEGTVALTLPEGWSASGSGQLAPASDESQSAASFIITPASTAELNTRFRLDATLTTDGGTATTSEPIASVPPVRGTLRALPEIEQFRDWADELDVPQLDTLIKPRLSIPSGEAREVEIDVRSFSAEPQSGSVALELPAGFETAETEQTFTDLPPGGSTSVVFTVTNVDPSLPTANEGGDEGDYDFSIVTSVGEITSTQTAALNLVPTTLVPGVQGAGGGPALAASPAASPVASLMASPTASPVAAMPAVPQVDGTIGDGEYTGEGLDLSRVWEGDDPESAQDASGIAYLAWDTDGLYVAVDVTDDTLGTVLPVADAKRHWRTDSVEIAIDPLGTASNTSATFKVGLFPTTEEGTPAAYRDADARQGPVAETAPNLQVASTVSDPFSGYIIETFIPFDA